MAEPAEEYKETTSDEGSEVEPSDPPVEWDEEAVLQKQRIQLPLLPEQRLLLEARETRLALHKTKIVAQIDKVYELQKQNAITQALKNSPEVVAAENMLDTTTNQILDEVAPRLPQGYAVTRLSWESGSLTAEHAPNQVGQRR